MLFERSKGNVKAFAGSRYKGSRVERSSTQSANEKGAPRL